MGIANTSDFPQMLFQKRESDFEVSDEATKSQIKKAFIKSLNNKKTNKKILSEFISIVA